MSASMLIENWFFLVILLLCVGIHFFGHGHGHGHGHGQGGPRGAAEAGDDAAIRAEGDPSHHHHRG